MDRLQKKCFLFSSTLHGFLLLLLVVGAAFVPSTKNQQVDLPKVRVVPTELIDGALAGGGGNPNIKPSDAQQKGDTLIPQPPVTVAPPQKTVKPPPEPVAKQEPRPEPKKITKTPKEKAAEPVKNPKPSEIDNAKDAPLALKPATRTNQEKVRAREAAEQAAAEREWANTTRQLAKQLGGATSALRTGFSQGTEIEVWGTGGAAYADYSAFVKSVYDDAWVVMDTMTDEDGRATVKVTIARSGHVISAVIISRSGNAMLDRSVQRALNKVRFVAPFPAGSKDQQRSFTIIFDLKAKRLIG